MLDVVSLYPEVASLDDHLVEIRSMVERLQPTRLVIDSLSALERIGSAYAYREFVISMTSFIRTVGLASVMTAASSELVGATSVTESHISGLIERGIIRRPVRWTLEGSAGQSFGAFSNESVELVLIGQANDYVGKGLSGATIVVRPSPSSTLVSQANTIIGNTVLYGATAGELFAAGQAGERFAVRNSGAVAVVEGCGSNGCEYMTGGTVVLLGAVGDNFGAGFTGGMAFVYDPEGMFEKRVNPDTLTWQRVGSAHWDRVLRGLVARHAKETHSRYAASLLLDWGQALGRFWQVVPSRFHMKATASRRNTSTPLLARKRIWSRIARKTSGLAQFRSHWNSLKVVQTQVPDGAPGEVMSS